MSDSGLGVLRIAPCAAFWSALLLGMAGAPGWLWIFVAVLYTIALAPLACSREAWRRGADNGG